MITEEEYVFVGTLIAYGYKYLAENKMLNKEYEGMYDKIHNGELFDIIKYQNPHRMLRVQKEELKFKYGLG